ncbi:hypothetical protein [Candidatus Thiosymbion oneisti]|uniref:hypothetical protein n=1 Tax=Candidatus Thiosymbion oneisti TaxID=589554 RepID=UPI001FB704A4|nr:hypothetical protein [Candidatus Thiosymbion oneisti]
MSRIQGSGRAGERRLVKRYRSLEPADQDTLLAFGEFLASRGTAHAQQASAPLEPTPMPRPREESVVGAIKRLSRKFHMLDRSAMLNDTSALMGAHVLQGRPVGEVIDELEELFARHYAEYRAEQARKQV